MRSQKPKRRGGVRFNSARAQKREGSDEQHEQILQWEKSGLLQADEPYDKRSVTRVGHSQASGGAASQQIGAKLSMDPRHRRPQETTQAVHFQPQSAQVPLIVSNSDDFRERFSAFNPELPFSLPTTESPQLLIISVAVRVYGGRRTNVTSLSVAVGCCS